MRDEQLDRLPAKAQLLIAGIDHKAPEIIDWPFGALWFIMEHEKADRRLIGIDGAEPGMFRKVRLGD